MNASTSEYSGECESGWTAYLDQISSSSEEDQCNRNIPVTVADSRRKGVYVNRDEDDEQDEDSSMLSDASSGPPHFHNQDEDYCEETRYNSSISASGQKKQGKNRDRAYKDRRSISQNHAHLDDTASSPVRSISMNNAVPRKHKLLMEKEAGFSQGLSATNSKGKSGLKKHLGFLKSSHHQKS
ncbi:OLC1v1017043C3 [Oldenlandia corymbosa var. corymbosa]|uniref:OLC1v1017043C3 n=1 Tax=Oldenlandia corymbosa var. corymbosa TaxID=529605 RepID=A0AAV1E8N3_OLDCO|nr:OLC1v1017043C3 [Oldenlandia corymbosa var. corymbosa]